MEKKIVLSFLAVLLGALDEAKPLQSLPAKSARQISVELFTSLFVLQSRFQFKPVVGRSYWLYRREAAFCLSLIAPEEGGGAFLGQAIGECVLQPDITWSLELTSEAQEDTDLMDLIEKRRAEFEAGLSRAKSIGEALPYYVEKMPFYQRVFAAGLAQSLGVSATHQGIAELSYDEALGLLSQSG